MKKIVSVLLAIVLLLSLISCEQERTWNRDAEASKDRDNTDSNGAEESTKKPESLPEETLTPEPEAAILPLQAEDLSWIVEPIYDYDDVEPIWARDFSDCDGPVLLRGLTDVADGQTNLLGDYGIWGGRFTEMNFPMYSCLDEYYYTSKGNERTLFYMPEKIDSGNFAPDKGDYSWIPYVINDGGIIAKNTKFGEPWGDGVWSVLFYTTYTAASAKFVWAAAENEAYFVWNFAGPGYYAPMSELIAPLHKPYPAQQAKLSPIDHDNPDAYRYASSLDPHYGFVDPEGNLITAFVYDEVGSFSDGLCAVCQNGKWGYIDESGREITEFIFDAVWTIGDTYTEKSETNEYYIELNRKISYPCTSDTIVVSKDGKLGVLYRDGTLLIDYGQFEDLAPAWNNELWAKQDGKWGLIDLAAAKRSAGLPEGKVSRPSEPSEEETASNDTTPTEKSKDSDGSTVVASGDCSNFDPYEGPVEWSLDSAGVLTISGSAKMADWEYPSDSPWHWSRDKIKQVVIQSGVTSIGDSAFWGCSALEKVTIPDTVTSIGDSAFGMTILTNVTIPSSVLSIGDAAFAMCWSLKNATLEDGVNFIGRRAFELCTSFTNVTIPDSVTFIENEAFKGCDLLVIHCVKGSYAEKYAKEKAISYISE